MRSVPARILIGTALLLSATCAVAAQESCEIARIGPLSDELVEASGIIRDPRRPDVLWIHNDSGHQPGLYAVGLDGRLIGHALLDDVPAIDVEDISLGPCGPDSCFFLGDIGDNLGFRPFVTVYRLPLPELPTGGADGIVLPSISPTAILKFRYPEGPQDAESLVVDGARGDLVILTKGRNGEVRVYSSDLEPGVEAETSRPVALTFRGVLDIPTAKGISHQATAADLSPDGNILAVRTYVTLYFLRWNGAAAFDASIRPDAVDLRGLDESQGEGLAFDQSGEQVYLVSEGQRYREPFLSTARYCQPRD